MAGFSLAYVGGLVVHQDFRNLGVGHLIVEWLTAFAKARDCRRLELDSGFARMEAHRFYESCGFEKRAYLFSKVM